ncbi:MAG: transcription-repair coupling factor [Dehalococcoidales bacterium]|nr:transcription-repair coupling factor [Dehalococcoidales bacterium]
MEILNLNSLLGLVERLPVYRQLIDDIKAGNRSTQARVIENARPFLLAALSRTLHRPLFIVTAHSETARQLYEQLVIWSGPEHVRLLPEPDALPYERITPDSLTALERLRVLADLAAADVDTPLIFVAPAHAFIMKQPPHNLIKGSFHTIKAGMNIDPQDLMKRWQALGYQTESIVEIPGTMGKRGGIIDIYPPTAELPARLEFFGNTIESIRLYDPASQRSQKKVDSLNIGLAAELIVDSSVTAAQEIDGLDFSNCNEEGKARFVRDIEAIFRRQKVNEKDFYAPLFNRDSLLHYLPPQTLLVIDEPVLVQQAAGDLDEKAAELRQAMQAQGMLPNNYPEPYFKWDDLAAGLAAVLPLELATFGSGASDKTTELPFTTLPNYSGQLPALIDRIKQLQTEKQRVVVISHQANRLSELLSESDIFATPLTQLKQLPLPGSLTLLQGLTDGGWHLDGGAYLFTDTEIFGFTKQQRFQKKRPIARNKIFADIKPGEFVVHIEHGIGEFMTFAKLNNNGVEREYLVLKYAAGDTLYVPTDQIDRVSRYIGSGEQKPSLSRLGTQEWTRTKQRAREATEEIARDLLNLYASREVVTGFKFSPDTVWQHELEASFPYVETPDQITVQAEIKEDMEKTKPMDRLVCGDVGYGKTEVALRAAFKAVMDDKQVAVLVPTTVLAQQHFVTFSERMKAFPVKVEVLSRFRSARDQKQVLEGLSNGSVDICIGTHRIIQKDIKFKDLGLLIIDEEQRFGVGHKEYLKKMRQEVAVLALSATPIPRTLHMSLVGVRDMSTMETPPEARLPIKTYVAEYNERIVREAILRELERDGQVFFVHNRVQSIEMIANKIRDLVPEASVMVGHGQMAEGELEKVTQAFIKGEGNVLVCTTIIESGLDMPRVNTMIINQADRLGLTQLYQLRGRVGRGATLAYAYFLFDKGKRITPIAEKRLRTIYEATELGAGFDIAMKDLEIRGAGNLLGMKQSGHISAVGFHLYSQLLSAAIENLKAQKANLPVKPKVTQMPQPTIDLPLSALIPEDYVSDTITRLALYQRLIDMSGEPEMAQFVQDLNDRFGPPPDAVHNLLYIVKIKTAAAKAGLESISADKEEITLRLLDGLTFGQKKLASVYRYGIKVGNTQLRFNLNQPGKGWKRVLEEVLGSLG